MFLGESGTGSTAPSSPTPSPAWPLIHFDVFCARCGHDLREQTDPVCPACKLEFSWEQAAPLEHLTCSKCNYHLYGIADARCPECGTAVDWNEALLRYRRREKPLFEYRWRDRPIRSFFRTWRLALRPARIWKEVDLHDPPQIGPLLVWALIFFFLTSASIPLSVAVGDWIQNRTLFGGTARPGFTNAFKDLIANIYRFVFFPKIYTLSAALFFWSLFSFLSLMVFRQSMRLCKMRTVHVVRVCAYSLFPYLPLVVVLLFLAVFGSSFFTRVVPLGRRLSVLGAGILPWVGVYCVVVWSLRQGYHRYAKMPHSLAVAFASQVMAVLATAAIPPAVIALIKGGW